MVRNVLEVLGRTSGRATVRVTEHDRRARVLFHAEEDRNGDGFSFAEEASVALHVSERILKAHGAGASSGSPAAHPRSGSSSAVTARTRTTKGHDGPRE